jgi:choice-of-anchor B domain-containing protein
MPFRPLRFLSLITTYAVAALALAGVASAQFHMTQSANVPGAIRGSVWGYVDFAGREYALACTGGSGLGLKIIEVTNPSVPVTRDFVPSIGSDLKEVKVLGKYAYCVNQSGALQIVDLGFLPDSGSTVGSFSSATIPGQHAIWIDSPYVYLGMNGAGLRDYRILDLSNPLALTEVSGTPHPLAVCVFADAHDSYVRGDLAYVANLSAGFMILDITNRAAPIILSTTPYPGCFTHSMRVTADCKYMFTTDELADGHLRVWDVQNPASPFQVTEYKIPGRIIHNVFLKGNWLFVSYYTDGVRVFDVTDPTMPTEVGWFDTYTQGLGNIFNGCWDVYPYFPSGNIVTSDITNGLNVMQFDDNRAAHYSGSVTDNSNSQPIAGASVLWVDPVSGETNTTYTNATGNYLFGVPGGSVNLVAGRSGYTNSILPQSVVVPGNYVQNFSLVRSAGGELKLSVSGASLSGGHKVAATLMPDTGIIVSPALTTLVNFGATNASTYTLVVSQWGRKTVRQTVVMPNHDTTVAITLPSGYEDPFEANLGWKVGSTKDSSTAGIWERCVPNGTLNGAIPVQPGADHGTGIDQFCWVTGQAPVGAAIGATDIDNGKTTLTSPLMDFTGMGDPYIRYYRWFTNNQGANPNTDPWRVELSSDSGQNWVILENTLVTDASWSFQAFRVIDFRPLTNNMMIRFIGDDQCPGSVIEAGIDDFEVIDVAPPSCCVGGTGNVDCDVTQGEDIADLSTLIDFLYITFTPLCCDAEANVDGDISGGVDISDLSALIDYLYISFTPPANCL